MPLDAWLTLLVLAGIVAVSLSERVDPALALGGGVGLLLLAGVLSPQRALEGFANPAVPVIGMLFVLVAALERSPVLPKVTRLVFGEGGPWAGSLGAVAGLSMFVANATVVAVMMPAVRQWARRTGRAVSVLMMPVGFAATLGGMLTLVGTSTNLVVDGMLVARGDPGLGFFELARVGLPVALAGILFMALAGRRLLPERRDPLQEADANPREYVGWLRVVQGGPLDGRPLSELRSLRDLFVAGLERDGHRLAPVEPGERLRGGDILALVGRVEGLAELARLGGLEPVAGPEDRREPLEDLFHLAEAVVSPSSPIVGRNIREAGFRGRYDAVVLAVHRHGEHLPGKIGDIVIQAGDTLLLAAGPDFLERWRYARDFYLVSAAGSVEAGEAARGWVAPAVLAAVLLVVATGLVPLLHAVVGGVLVVLATGAIRPAEVWSTVQWPTLVMIAASLALSHAMVDSGLARVAVAGSLSCLDGAAPGVVIVAALLITALLTEVLDNPAAAALVLPLAAAAGEAAGAPLHAMAAAVAVGASSSFLTPFGYHANVMVAGSGGYAFRDFLRYGLPLKALVLLVAALVIPLVW